MQMRGKPLRVRTVMVTIAAFALAIASIREAAIWYETRGFISFHQQRARWLRDKAEQFPSNRDDLARDFRLYAAWHDERALSYRRAHRTYFSDEMIEDFRQTEQEQAREQILYANSSKATANQPPATKP
jgi:hypothetical protein